jgi:YVTN family beta-propeller protein/VCBS repeat-containing protein
MGNAKYVGRVGALAVALGIGTAVATMPWVAVAEPSADSTSASDSSSSTASSAAESTSTGDAKPATSVDSSGGADTAADSGASNGDPRSGIVASSSAGVSEDEEAVVSTEAELTATPESPEPNVAEPATDLESSTPEQPLVPETPPPVTESVTLTEPSDNDDPAPAQPMTVHLPPAHAPAAKTDTADPDTGLHGFTNVGAADKQGAAMSVQSVWGIATASSAPATAMAAQLAPVAQAAPENPVAVVSDLVSGLLAWVGLGPSLNAPAAPVQSPGLLGLLAWIGHEIRRTFFNQTPTTAYDPVENSQAVDGVVTGDLHAVDPDGDPLSIHVTEGPQIGSVVVNPDGTFTYTPSAQLATTGGTDQFTVEVEDQGLHVHGLPGLLNLVTFGLLGDSGHHTTATVTLTVQPINQPPQAGNPAFTIDSVDPNTGVVIGTVNITDPDGDTLTYSLSGVPTEGSFTVNPSGQWTYIPSLDARLSATDINAAPADQQVSFSIVASDGLAITWVTVTAPVTPLATTTITVGEFPLEVAVSPDGTRAYVTNFNDNTVSVIDTATNGVIATVAVVNVPAGVAVSPDGTAYVTSIGNDNVSVIDPVTNAVVTTIGVGDGPVSVAVSPDGATAYVTNASGDSVSVIDTATNAVVATIGVGDNPFYVAVSPDGAHVYVANSDGDTVSVIDTATKAVVATIGVGDRPFRLAVSPDGATAYVSNGIASTLSVIDTATNTVTTTIPVAGGNVAVSPDGAHVYVTNQFGDSVSVIDTATNTVTANIAVGDNPRGVAISPDGTHLYVTSASDGSVTVITLG